MNILTYWWYDTFGVIQNEFWFLGNLIKLRGSSRRGPLIYFFLSQIFRSFSLSEYFNNRSKLQNYLIDLYCSISLVRNLGSNSSSQRILSLNFGPRPMIDPKSQTWDFKCTRTINPKKNLYVCIFKFAGTIYSLDGWISKKLIAIDNSFFNHLDCNWSKIKEVGLNLHLLTPRATCARARIVSIFCPIISDPKTVWSYLS